MQISPAQAFEATILLELLHKITNAPSVINPMSSFSQPSIQPSNFKLILDAALSEYKTKTGKELLDHPLATEVQRCDTVDAALAILQDQAKAFHQFKDGDHRLTESISPLVQVLFAFSGTLAVGDVGLVLLIRGDSTQVLTSSHRLSPPQKESLLALLSFLPSVSSPLFSFLCTLLIPRFIGSKGCEGESRCACRTL